MSKNTTSTTQAQTTNTSNGAERYDVDGHIVTVKLSVAREKGGESVPVVAEIDYAGVDMPTILRWATSNRVIALQGALRGLELAALKALASQGTIRRKAMEVGLAFASPEKAKKQAVDAFERLSPEEQAEVLAKLQAAMAAQAKK